ncbi:hypothetical protein MPL1032_30033 [Mesorhizobium plurifarium]|uniref:Uncharacterized protein n=1 Tax=Mesorhizobium plurifarium TaxID=69974 RepID=A0A0K2W363_MESPL|nr:hypothetical protein MPL1032_30033 [Mesorhizobium plurifarium]
MCRKRFKVPRQPSRHSMNAMRKATAQSERQNTTVQLSPIWMKRAMVPPKLHISADRKTRSMPIRSSRGETAGKAVEDGATGDEAVSVMAGDCQRVAFDTMHQGRQRTASQSRSAKAQNRRDPASGEAWRTSAGIIPGNRRR